MESVLSILQSLGVNQSVWVQLSILVSVILFLKFFVFSAYLKAFEERQKLTVGAQGDTETLHTKARELETIYQRKARNLVTEIKAAFDKEKLAAQAEHERLLLQAKDKAKEIVDGAKATIEQEYSKAREELVRETKPLGEAMAARLFVKD